MATSAKMIDDRMDAADRAIAAADANVLRMALYQITRDPDLSAIDVIKVPVRGGVLEGDALRPEDEAIVREKALDFIRARIESGDADVPPPPSRDDAYTMLRMFTANPMSHNELRYGFEELAFDEFPRDVEWAERPPQAAIDAFEVLIVGAGISGLALGISLNRLGIPYRIIDKNPNLGGTWWTNDYPDARVDVSSYLYQFKFEKNYPWTQYYASRDETLKYLEHIADKYQVREKIELDTALVSAEWIEGEGKWSFTTRGSDGTVRTGKVNAIISAAGLFATPKLPDIKGIETFKGAMFHTTQWDHSYDYSGKRVGLIGNGSTGSQLMPGIAAKASHMTVFQRTAQWVMPAENYRATISEDIRWLFDNFPYYWNWYCYSSFATTSRLQELQVYDAEWQAQGGRINRRNDKLREILIDYIQNKIGDRPDLHEKLMPSFPPLGRRSVIDNGWYDALRQDHVELVTESIERIVEDGVITTDGRHHKLDMLILAAGFQAHKFLHPVKYTGVDGRVLEDFWEKDGPRSYLGITVPHFPNLFISYGPNGQPRSGGFYSWAEIWSRYVMLLITRMIANGEHAVEVKEGVFQDYNDRQDKEMEKLIWLRDSAKSYYINEFGRVGLNVPWETSEYYGMVAEPTMTDFDFR